MPISDATLRSYAPWGNAELAFELETGLATVDPTTGNARQAPEIVEYLAALTLEAPSWKPQPGVDQITYACSGRLLTPAVLDQRITNGTQAEARVNGVKGRFELVFDLAQDAFHRRDLRQLIRGTFTVLGGGR